MPSSTSGIEWDIAQYKGNFRQGMRDGEGKMVWSDGSVFYGTWHNDQRVKGTMIMNNGFVYEGHFKNDKFHGDNETLRMPDLRIYKGRFRYGKTCSVGMVLYPEGDIYYGQMR